MATLTDDFNRSDGALGGDWLNESTGYTIVSNRARAGSGTNRSLLNVTTLGLDQYAQAVFYGIPTVPGGGDHEGPGIAVRFGKSSWPGGAWDNAYHVLVMTNKLSLFKGFFTLLETQNATTADGDTVRIEVSGSSGTAHIVVKRNGTTIIEYDDSSSPYESANHVRAGMTAYRNGTNEIDDFEAGDLSAGGSTTKANLIKQVSRYHLGVGSLGRIQRRS